MYVLEREEALHLGYDGHHDEVAAATGRARTGSVARDGRLVINVFEYLV